MITYSPSEFLHRLSDNDLPASPAPFLTGLVKLNSVNSEELFFSITPKCETWVAIPLSAIETISHSRNLTCSGQTYPYVRLNLKPGAAAQQPPEICALLERKAKNIASLQERVRRSHPSILTNPVCEVLEFDGEVYICCCEAGNCECGGIV